MQKISLRNLGAFLFMAMFLGACALQFPSPQAPGEPQVVAPPPVPKIDPMADVPGDRPLAPLAGAMERIDCMSGVEDLHARMALEARGGRITSFAYYSKWKPRTCSVHLQRGDAFSRWKDTGEASVVTTEYGDFMIQTSRTEFQLYFRDVDRMHYCGMMGKLNGSMTVSRGPKRQCTVVGIMDRNETEALDTQVASGAPDAAGEPVAKINATD